MTNRKKNEQPDKIVLTIQKSGQNQHRLGIPSEHSKKIFKKRGVRVWVNICGHRIECFTACGPSNKKGHWIERNPKTKKPFRKKGYDLNKNTLSKILIKFSKKIKRYSKRLDFRLRKTKDGFSVTFLRFTDFPDKKTCP